jgi:DNA modification methylase
MIRVLHGDCRDVLPTLAAVDAVVTDPPYHLVSIVKRFGGENAAPAQFGRDGAFARASRGFMGKQWDGGDIAFQPETWRLVFDAMKPGAFLAAFASTRGYHRMTCAIEDAGFIVHPFLAWIFATGFPKATRFKDMPELEGWRYGLQALKPAIEPICLAQRPMEGTGPENWRKHGTGGLNIDACRVPASGRPRIVSHSESSLNVLGNGLNGSHSDGTTDEGRWPANVLHDGSPEVLAAFAAFGDRAGGSPSARKPRRDGSGWDRPCNDTHDATKQAYQDAGTAARFFYSSKADAADRADSSHPTVKPVALMRWLVRLITPPGGTVLDPFAGSGTTGEAAMLEGMHAILIEQDAQHAADIEHRIRRWSGLDAPLFAEAAE